MTLTKEKLKIIIQELDEADERTKQDEFDREIEQIDLEMVEWAHKHPEYLEK